MQNSNLDDIGDVQLFFPGDRFPVTAGPNLLGSGWRGGLFVMFVPAAREFTVEVSDGSSVAGFLLFQSEYYSQQQPGSFSAGSELLVGSPENYLSHQFLSGNGGQNLATMISGGTRAFFKAFETTALNGAGARVAGAINYNLNDRLRVSENGLLCNDSVANLNAAGVTNPTFVGIVSAVPAAENGNRLCMDMKY